MKVAHLTGPLGKRGGGIPYSVLPLARDLAKLGHDVSVLSTEPLDADPSRWRPARIAGFPFIGPEQFSYCREMTNALDREDADLVHTHGLWRHPSVVARRWKAAGNGKRIVSVHGMLNESALKIATWKKRIALRMYENAHLREADCIHALSDAEGKAVRDFGLSNPIAVVPNGVTLPTPLSADVGPDWEAAVPQGKNVLLYLGRLHPIKGLIELIEGWHSACTSAPDCAWVLVIAGWDDADMLGSMRETVATLKLQDSVFFVGPQFDDAKRLSLQSADAFILPSTSEGLPVAVLEAWSHGLPVLMSRNCNLDIGFDVGAAIEANPDREDIEAGLLQLFGRTATERQDMGARGRTLVEKRFTWVAAAEKMSAVYEWLTGARPAPDCVDI